MRTIARTGIGARDGYVGAAPSVSGETSSTRFQYYEYAYYLIFFYSVFNTTLGITIPFLGTFCLMGLAALCILRRKSSALAIYRPLFRPMLCAVSFIIIQYYIHEQGVSGILGFAVWAATLVIIQSLHFRPGFFRRYSFMLFGLGLALLPFLDMRGTRAGLSTQSALSNPNELAALFGYCFVSFIVRGLQTPRFLDRLVSGGIAFTSLLIVGLTVSRGALSAIVLATVVVFQKQLKRGFVPLVILVALLGAGLSLGVFDNAIKHYTDRGAEETGRLLVFPLVVQRILGAPLVGVGAANIGTPTPGHEMGVYPHNSLLFLALASGVVPLFFFLAYWSGAFLGALHASPQHPYRNYLMPLLVYCSFYLLVHDSMFMSPYFAATCAACVLESRQRRGKSPRLTGQRTFKHPESRVFTQRRA